MERVRVEGGAVVLPEVPGGRGFHVAFRRVGETTQRKLDVVLVCPSCGFRFTAGDFRIPDGERVRSIPRSTRGLEAPRAYFAPTRSRSGEPKSRPK